MFLCWALCEPLRACPGAQGTPRPGPLQGGGRIGSAVGLEPGSWSDTGGMAMSHLSNPLAQHSGILRVATLKHLKRSQAQSCVSQALVLQAYLCDAAFPLS